MSPLPAARPAPVPLTEKDILCLGHLRRVFPLLDRLHDVGCDRDSAGNRELFFSDYCKLMLVYIWNPLIDSVRRLQEASTLANVAKALGIKRFSLGSFSEAPRVFDPDQLKPRIDRTGARNAGQDRENNVLRARLEPGRCYVGDGGYADRSLFDGIVANDSCYVMRMADNAVFEVVEERLLSQPALDANIVRDAVVRLGDPDLSPTPRRRTVLPHLQTTPGPAPSAEPTAGGHRHPGPLHGDRLPAAVPDHRQKAHPVQSQHDRLVPDRPGHRAGTA